MPHCLDDVVPGTWIDLSVPGRYDHLVLLARRHLVGQEHHAADVVSRALIKWRHIPGEKRGVARIEQVIRSEANSLLRSEKRLKGREARASLDRSRTVSAGSSDHDWCLLRQALVEVSYRMGVSLSEIDLEVFELLVSGLTMAQVARTMNRPRHLIKASRTKWQRIIDASADPQIERPAS